MTPEEYIHELTKAFKKHSNPQLAVAMQNYLLGQFSFFGIQKPKRNEIIKPIYLKAKKDITEAWIIKASVLLWAMKEREYHYAALDLFEKNKRIITPMSFKTLEKMIVTNSWWDSVDGISSYAIAPLVLKHPELKKEMERFSTHKNFWLKRVSIIHQLLYKTKTDKEFLFKVCKLNWGDDEFFIRKAIGWALRQYAKTNPDDVYQFVEANKHKLSNLSIREALKHK